MSLLNKYFKADHPITCLNPNEYNRIVEVKNIWCSIDSRIKTYIRGEGTMWFADNMIINIVEEVEC